MKLQPYEADRGDASKLAELEAELGRRHEIDGERWVTYDVPEYGMTTSLRCGSRPKRKHPDDLAMCERIVAGLAEPSPGLLVFLGLALPYAANIQWADDETA